MTPLSQPSVAPTVAPCSSSAEAQHPNDVFGRLFRACEGLPAVRCAVVHPCDADSLGGAIAAAQRGLIVPVLVGPQAKIRAVAKEGAGTCRPGVSWTPSTAMPPPMQAVALARAGEVQALMKGSLHTDELMGAVVPRPRACAPRAVSATSS
jgi:phosphotransacetylase